jgi:hypothetical protein
LSGRVRSVWTEQFNAHRIPRRRLVKEIRATNLLPWITTNFPGLPVVYLLRHPVASAVSATELQWDSFLSEFLGQQPLMSGPLQPFADIIAEHADADLFHRHVLRWCMENYVPVRLLAPASVHVVFYENLVEDPTGELDRLRGFLSRFTPRWDLAPGTPAAVHRLSPTNFRDTPALAAQDRLQSWRHDVSEADVHRALAVVRGFGLDRLYAEDVRPRISPDAVLQHDPR